MEEIKIEKGIPIPTAQGEGKWIKLARKMDVGDSFFIPCKDKPTVKRTQSGVLACVKRRGANMKFVTRKVEGGLRVWRVE